MTAEQQIDQLRDTNKSLNESINKQNVVIEFFMSRLDKLEKYNGWEVTKFKGFKEEE